MQNENPQHTPGPWNAYLPDADSEHYYEVHDGYGRTATVYGDDSEAAANARLIAAAPELLAALRLYFTADSESFVTAALAAIGKAEREALID
jgi:hypothetical protein